MIENILILFGFLFLPGYFITCTLFPERISKIDRFFMTIIVSTGINTLLLFYLGIINQIKPVPIIFSWVLINGILIFFAHKKNRNIFDFRSVMNKVTTTYLHTYLRSRIKLHWKIPFLLYCSFIVLLAFYHSAFFPFYSCDAVASFNMWGKGIASYGGLGGSTSIGEGYPQFWPLTYAWFYVLSGETNEHVTHLLSPIFGLIALFYSYRLAEKIRGNGVLTITFLLSTPWFIHHLNAGYADLPFSAFIVASAYYSMLALKKDANLKYLLLAGFILGSAFLMKIRGVYFISVMPLAYVLLMKFYHKLNLKDAIKRYAIFFGVALLVFAPWYLRYHLVYTSIGKGSSILGTIQAPIFMFSIPFIENVNLVVQLIYNSTPLAILVIYLIGIFFMLLVLIRYKSENMLIAIIVLPYLIIGVLGTAYEFRYLVHVLPLISVQSSVVIQQIFLKFSERDFSFKILTKLKAWIFYSLIIIILSASMITSAQDALRGTTVTGVSGPNMTWTITHPLASDDEKLIAIFGDMYKTVLFLENNESFHGKKIAIHDVRIGSYVPAYWISIPYTFSELTGYDYFVLWRSSAYYDPWNKAWVGSEVEINLRDTAHSFFSPQYISGDYTIYKIDQHVLTRINSIFLGESKVHPIFSTFSIYDGTNNYIWIEGEDDTNSFGEHSDEVELYGIASKMQHKWLKGIGSYSEHVFNVNNSGNYIIWMRLAGWDPINISLDNISFGTIRVSAANYTWHKVGDIALSNTTTHTLRVKAAGDGYSIYDVISITDDAIYIPTGHGQPIKAGGKPDYTMGRDIGYYIWQDDAGWHIRWTSPTRYEFKGDITNNGIFENVRGYAFEENDYTENDNTTIRFSGVTSGDEDGIDFKTTGTEVTFEIR